MNIIESKYPYFYPIILSQNVYIKIKYMKLCGVDEPKK